jgi:hypothetical protein
MSAADPNRGRGDLGPTVVLGLVAGAALQLLTDALSKTDIGGRDWSLRGNGSLIVLFVGAATVLALGWLALAARARASSTWLRPAALGALVVLALELIFGFAPIVLAPTNVVLPLAIGCLVVALSAGVALARGGLRAGSVVALIGLALSLAPVGLQFVLLPIFLPLVVAMPSLWLGRGRWLAASSVALPIALLVGLYFGQLLTNR